MAAKGYCTPEEVAAFLSRTLTEEQTTQLGNIIEASEQWIDDRLGYGYGGGPVTNAYRTAWNNQFYLGPLASIESLQYYGYAQDVPYTIADSTKGLVRIGYSVNDGTGFLIDFTPASDPPARVKRACIVLSAHWLMPTLDPDRFGAKQYTFSGDFSAQFIGDPIPAEVYELLNLGGDVILA